MVSNISIVKDEDLGDIKEIMLDMRSGRIAYAVLSFGGVLGMGEKLFAIPSTNNPIHDSASRCEVLVLSSQEDEQIPRHTRALIRSVAI